MRLWRISNHADLLGVGGMLASARWHTAGQPVVYLAESPASALLEVLVHLEVDGEHRPATYRLLCIEAEGDVSRQEIGLRSLSAGWRNHEAETRDKGDEWLQRGASALLRIPSAIVPETWNWVLNPRHPDAGKVRILGVQTHLYDTRLLRP